MIKRVDKAVDLTEELKKDVCGLRRGEAEPTCIKTSTRLIVKTNFKIKKLMKSKILLLFLFKRVIIKNNRNNSNKNVNGAY